MSGAAIARVFFFFQAEDGIRDWSVTGVQTCALPICQPACASRAEIRRRRPAPQRSPQPPRTAPAGPVGSRSEERRVGKSVDLRGARTNKKKKKSSRWKPATMDESIGTDTEQEQYPLL